MAGLGDRKRFEVHFRLTDEQGEELLALVRRLDLDMTGTCRNAVSVLLEIAATAPAELAGPRLLVFILDRVQAIPRSQESKVKKVAQARQRDRST